MSQVHDVTTSDLENLSPTEDEVKNLRHVVDDIPGIVWIAAFVGAAERFTFYGITAPWRM